MKDKLTWMEINIIAEELGITGNCYADSVLMRDVVQNPKLYLNLIERRKILSKAKTQ